MELVLKLGIISREMGCRVAVGKTSLKEFGVGDEEVKVVQRPVAL